MSLLMHNLGTYRAGKAAAGQAVDALAGMYIGLLWGYPIPAGVNPTLTEYAAYEPTSDDYARQAVTWSDPYAAMISSGTAPIFSNATKLTFGPFTGAWADSPVIYAFLTDVVSGTVGDVYRVVDS